ncbi:NRDE family protein [Leucobacter luti]|nr:NRDE family protein [Leucobacter luti]MBL3698336.1 hypothetical protein [Leucobacter luti]
MCTVVVEIPSGPADRIRVLAVRDEDPARAWDPPGRWWPDTHPDTVGVRDRRANGAWLAYAHAPGRLAVVLNRGAEVPEPVGGFASRGGLVLDAIAGAPLTDPPRTAAFTRVSVTTGSDAAGGSGGGVEVASWDGHALRREALPPGIHMVDHFEVDDPASSRIARWLPEFRALAGAPDDAWRAEWLALLARTTEISREDDRAIIRDNHPHGYPTQSLLVCIAEVAPGGVALDWAPLTEPGVWGTPEFRPADA